MLPGPLLPVVAEAKGDALGGVDAKGEVVDPPAPNGVALVVFPVQSKQQKTSLKCKVNLTGHCHNRTPNAVVWFQHSCACKGRS